VSVLFVSTELSPYVKGGAGTVVSELLARLTDAGMPATACLVSATEPAVPLPPGVRGVSPGDPDDGAPTPFLAASRAAAHAVRDRPADLIEFQDFDGLAFWALAHRRELGLDRVPIAVRFHGPVDLMFEAAGPLPPELRHVRVMERHSYAMADMVIVPSPAIGELAIARYGLEPARVVIGEPPVPRVERIAYRRTGPPELVCLGRLGEVKGSHDLLAAMLPLLEDHPDLSLRYIGADGWSVTAAKPMRAWLQEQVPESLRHRVLFEQHLAPDDLARALSSTWAVVVPSRFESFNLTAHQARAMGLPVVVPDLPAFGDFFSAATGACVYDGSVGDLTRRVAGLLAEPSRFDELAAAPLPTYADPLAPYTAETPPIRHPRVQAGLATAAVQEVEAVAAEPAAAAALPARLARWALRLLPAWAARVAVRVLPRQLKDRFRELASWPEEAQRRIDADRRRAVMAAIEAGAFPDLADPEVTIVIPCFNQGAFVDEAIQSVFSQTYGSWEIVVVDDGSDEEDTRRVLDGLAYPRTRLVRQDNRGLAAARNAGIRRAKGEFVVPLDADDRLAPTFLEELHRALADQPAAAFAHCWAELFGDVTALWASRPYNPYQLLLSNSIIGCVLMRKSAWEQVGGYDESLRQGNEDWDLWIRYLEAGWSQVAVDRALFHYRKHGVSMSVETEARFEEARREMAQRHPRLYARMAEMKRSWYPLVSIIAPTAESLERLAEQSIDDAEIVVDEELANAAERVAERRGWGWRIARSAAALSAHGKFLVDWGLVRSADPGLLQAMADQLESHPNALAASPEAFPAPLMWRRWPVLDPAAPHTEVATVPVAADSSGAPTTLGKGAFPTAGFFVGEWDGPVQRQQPEEDGYLPDWVS
jgi:glycosyltransferase involved in cell wall biosynthesis/GT2 family glycosyltransferase